MFGIGMPELILILAVALIVIGPKKLPDLAKSLGKAMGEFKKATNDIKDSMQLDSGIKEVKTSFEDLERELKKPLDTTEAKDAAVDGAGSRAAQATTEDVASVDALTETEADTSASGAAAPATDAPEQTTTADTDETPTPKT